MNNENYTVTAMRKNIDGKPDYKWEWKYTNGNIVKATKTSAEAKANSLMADESAAMYDVQVVELGEVK